MTKENLLLTQKKGAQLTLEAKIIEKIGDTAYSVHTGRSRNDQIMITEMLYLKMKSLDLMKSFIPILKELFKLAKNNVKTVMPGYTICNRPNRRLLDNGRSPI